MKEYKIVIETHDGIFRETATQEHLTYSGGDIKVHVRAIAREGYMKIDKTNGNMTFYPPHSIKKIEVVN